MYPEKHLEALSNSPTVLSRLRPAALTVLASLFLLASFSQAQSSGSASQDQQSQQQAQPSQGQQDQMPAAAGGPTGESGPIAVPKKPEGEEPPPPPKPKHEDIPQYSLHVDVPMVTVDAQIVMKDGHVMNLPLET